MLHPDSVFIQLKTNITSAQMNSRNLFLHFLKAYQLFQNTRYNW